MLRSSQSAARPITARPSKRCRSRSASSWASCAAVASTGTNNRDRSSVRSAAITSQSPQRPSSVGRRSGVANAAVNASTKASTKAAMDSRASSMRRVRARSSSKSSGPSKPSTASTGAAAGPG